MRKSLAEIASLVNGRVVGDQDVWISGVSGLQEAKADDLTFIAEDKYLPWVKKSRARALIVGKEVTFPGKTVVQVDNPSLAFIQVVELFQVEEKPSGIHPAAVVDPSAQLGQEVAVGPCAVIERGAHIGDRTVIHAGAYVGRQSVIGREGVVYPNVTIGDRVRIGDRVVIHSGSVIGSDGFGFLSVNGEHKKIPQIGIVEIEDDVEIGANVTVDRARFDKTVIGRGTKIDNLVQIAHNVILGKHCLIISQVGVSGSTVVEDGVILAGQVGVVGHITIGRKAVVAGRSGVTKSIKPGQIVMGFPAKPRAKELKIQAALHRLPTYLQEIKALKKRVEQLEKAAKNG